MELVNRDDIIALMEMQESGYQFDPENVVKPSWELAKDLINDVRVRGIVFGE